jgi:hypothetical protein
MINVKKIRIQFIGSPSLKDSIKYEETFGNGITSAQNTVYSDLSHFDGMPIVDSIDAIKCSSNRLKKIKEALDEPGVDFFALISKHDLKKISNILLKFSQTYFKMSEKE